MVTIPPSGIVRSFNPAAEEMFGFRGTEVVGRNISLLMPEPYFYSHDNYLARHLHESKQAITGQGLEVEGRKKDGSRFFTVTSPPAN